MGLDMYLSAKKYLSDYQPEDKEVKDAIMALPYPSMKTGMQVQEIVFEAMYWRKANAIHNWFVHKCQDGRDECQQTYVDVVRLRELVDTCKIVLADHSKVAALLPPSAGFFFGSTDVNDHYYEDLHATVVTLERILALDDIEDYSFYYQSSW